MIPHRIPLEPLDGGLLKVSHGAPSNRKCSERTHRAAHQNVRKCPPAHLRIATALNEPTAALGRTPPVLCIPAERHYTLGRTDLKEDFPRWPSPATAKRSTSRSSVRSSWGRPTATPF